MPPTTADAQAAAPLLPAPAEAPAAITAKAAGERLPSAPPTAAGAEVAAPRAGVVDAPVPPPAHTAEGALSPVHST